MYLLEDCIWFWYVRKKFWFETPYSRPGSKYRLQQSANSVNVQIFGISRELLLSFHWLGNFFLYQHSVNNLIELRGKKVY